MHNTKPLKAQSAISCRRKQDEVLVAAHDAVNVLVGVFVRRRDGTFVAHPEVDSVGTLPERFPCPVELASVLNQQLEFVRQVGVLEEWND